MALPDEASTPGLESPPSGAESLSVPHCENADVGQGHPLIVAAFVDCVLDHRLIGPDIEPNTELVETVTEDLERSAADGELYLVLNAIGFSGPEWELFAETLVRHGASVLTGWSRNGWIFKALRDHNVRLTPPVRQNERRRLATEGDFRSELIRPAVARREMIKTCG